MSDLSRVVEALDISYYRSSQRTVQKSVFLNGVVEKFDIIVKLENGNLAVGKNQIEVKEGQYALFPASKNIYVRHGRSDGQTVLGPPGFEDLEERKKFVPDVDGASDKSNLKELFVIAGFQIKIYGTVPFFSLMDIPVVIFEPDPILDMHFKMLIDEEANLETGRQRMLDSLAEGFFIRIFRLLESHPQHSSEVKKIESLLDKRLVNIVKYIRQNLDKDLSNKVVANIAFVSEDYVGQLFKSLTNRNLQEYIENERLESAFKLLTSGNENIQEIAHKVGFKDPAYFSRRFKLRYGENANTIRRKEQYVI